MANEADLSMEGGDPIRPRPEDINDMNAQFDATVDAKVDAEVERRTAKFTAERDTAVEAATAEGAKAAALATLGAMIDGNPGDTRGRSSSSATAVQRHGSTPFCHNGSATSRLPNTSPRRCA